MTEPGIRLSRRTLAKGMAWSVPAVAVAVAAPAVAASQLCAGTLCFGSMEVHKCCPPGNVDGFYWAKLTFTNTGTSPVNASYSFTLSPSSNPVATFADSASVAGGATWTSVIRGASGPLSNCSNATYPAFNITFSDGTHTGSVPVPAGNTGGNTCSGAPASLSNPGTDDSAPKIKTSTPQAEQTTTPPVDKSSVEPATPDIEQGTSMVAESAPPS